MAKMDLFDRGNQNNVFPVSKGKWHAFGNASGVFIRTEPGKHEISSASRHGEALIVAKSEVVRMHVEINNSKIELQILSAQCEYPILEDEDDELDWEDSYALSERIVYYRYPAERPYKSKEWVNQMTFRCLLDGGSSNSSYHMMNYNVLSLLLRSYNTAKPLEVCARDVHNANHKQYVQLKDFRELSSYLLKELEEARNKGRLEFVKEILGVKDMEIELMLRHATLSCNMVI